MSKNNNDKEPKQESSQKDIQPQNAPKAIVAQVKASAIFTGPLPPPQILAQYEQITPGFANRVMTFAEEQQRHRIELESQVIPETINVNKRGQIFAFIITILAIIAMGYFAYQGMQLAVIVMALVLCGGVMTTFNSGKNEQNNSMLKKAEELLKTKKMIEDSASKNQENSTNS